TLWPCGAVRRYDGLREIPPAPRSPAMPLPRLATPSLLLASLLGLHATPAPGRAGENPLREVIDAEVRAAWQREKLTPAPPSADPASPPPVYPAAVGTIPTYEGAKTSLADTDPQKRAKLIDRLLADPRYGVHQADVWDNALFGHNPAGGDATRKRDGFKKWL